VFWREVERLHEDFDSMQDTLLFYEATLKRVISTNIRQERKLNEVTQAFHHHLRGKEEYGRTREEARKKLDRIISTKYATLTNQEYLDPLFDFYSAGIRLRAHEREPIARDLVLIALERDKKFMESKCEALSNEVEGLKILLKASQDEEIKAKQMMWDAIRSEEQISKRSQDQIGGLETHIEHLLSTFKAQVYAKDLEFSRFRDVLDIETRVRESVNKKQQKIIKDQEEHLGVLEGVMNDFCLLEELKERVKKIQLRRKEAGKVDEKPI